ncbi:nucleotidyltransferase family protein [Arthrobacter sp. H14]|uniref:nucleotidyltransferase family protein n=1 Tax=Arthrobacter sp. H14 TaxID=1312959 RepID=UPI0004B02101|nr:nucleotidyltransferase family protein [Arthrobacter sp. H14]
MIVTAVLLAAGNGSRLGRGPKALLPYHGRPLVEHIAGALFDGGCDDVVVILGADAARVRAECRLERCTVVENPDWASGMASSFKAGVAAVGGADAIEEVGAAEDTDAVLIALVDQPHISAGLVQHLLQVHRPERITAAHYADARRPSHPMIFEPVYARQAAELAQDDAGARTFLRRNPDLIDLVDCTGSGDDADIDTADDLHLLEGESFGRGNQP